MVSNFKKNLMILLIWLILALIIIAISSVMVYLKWVTLTEKSVYIFACGVILFLMLGFLSGNIKQAKGLYNGIMLSFIVLIIIVLIQFLGLSETFSLNVLSKYAVFLLSGGLGGIFGVNFKPVVKN